MSESADDPVGTLSRGLHILLSLAKLGGRASLTELSEACGLHRGTVHRIAVKLVDLRFMERDNQARFALGVHVLDLGFSYLSSLDVRERALPELHRLRAELDCSVGLCVLDDTEMVYIERLESTKLEPTLRVAIGDRIPIHSSAVGKAVLAFLAPARQREILKALRFEPKTERTLRNRADLEADLQTTKRRGYAVSDQEQYPGYRAVAAPVFDRSGQPVAGVVAGAVVARFGTMRQIRESLAPRIVRACELISTRMSARREAVLTESDVISSIAFQRDNPVV